MSNMSIDKKNSENLTSLFMRTGVDQCESVYINHGWPNRCWLAPESNNNQALVDVLPTLRQSMIVPVWPQQQSIEPALLEAGFDVLFTQEAMYLPMDNYQLHDSSALTVNAIHTDQEVEQWTLVASAAFGYPVNRQAIHALQQDADVTSVLANIGGVPVATGLLLRTGDTIGVHMVGVPLHYRGKGIARILMKHIMNECFRMQAKVITLQASAMGSGLYIGLGFKKQFVITNYMRRIDKL